MFFFFCWERLFFDSGLGLYFVGFFQGEVFFSLLHWCKSIDFSRCWVYSTTNNGEKSLSLRRHAYPSSQNVWLGAGTIMECPMYPFTAVPQQRQTGVSFPALLLLPRLKKCNIGHTMCEILMMSKSGLMKTTRFMCLWQAQEISICSLAEILYVLRKKHSDSVTPQPQLCHSH